jgi:tetratricopeptide (TPR) repeat protein
MNNCLLPIVLLGSISVVSFALPASALSPVEVQRIARQTTVRIKNCDNGSGVIIQKSGNSYTILTAAHATRTEGCQVVTADEKEYKVTEVTRFINSVDLALIKFTSNKTYPVAKLIDNSDRVEGGETIYVSGFPVTTAIVDPIFTFVKGTVIGNGNKLQTKGYSMVYDNLTLPGHSGGPVWNDKGEAIAIHGQGDINTKLQPTDSPNVRIKTGFNLGITANTFIKLAVQMGIPGYAAPIAVAATLKPVDDFIASAVARERKGDYQGILNDMNMAIAINPKKDSLYYIRGNAKSELGDRRGAIEDYNRNILMNPAGITTAGAYYNRGTAKYKLGEWQQALEDYNSSIKINPLSAMAFYNRGNTKLILRDKQGAIDDYSRAIALNPKQLEAYSNRGSAKYEAGNYRGSIEDYDLAIAMNHPRLGKVYMQKGFSQYELGNISEAILSWRKALNLPYMKQDSQLGLAIALYRQGKKDEAFELGKLAIRTDNKLKNIQYLRDKNWSRNILKDAAKFLQNPRINVIEF